MQEQHKKQYEGQINKSGDCVCRCEMNSLSATIRQIDQRQKKIVSYQVKALKEESARLG